MRPLASSTKENITYPATFSQKHRNGQADFRKKIEHRQILQIANRIEMAAISVG